MGIGRLTGIIFYLKIYETSFKTKLFIQSDLFLIFLFQISGFEKKVEHQKWGRNAVCQNVKVGMIQSLLNLP
jgi:hypothetical protein